MQAIQLGNELSHTTFIKQNSTSYLSQHASYPTRQCTLTYNLNPLNKTPLAIYLNMQVVQLGNALSYIIKIH
jgi:hypothetical protein